MRDLLFKLRILRVILGNAVADYRAAVHDLDARMCCDGHECGCMGSTNRAFWEWEFRREPGK